MSPDRFPGAQLDQILQISRCAPRPRAPPSPPKVTGPETRGARVLQGAARWRGAVFLKTIATFRRVRAHGTSGTCRRAGATARCTLGGSSVRIGV